MFGFTYNGVHSNTYGIVAKSIKRPLLPSLVKRELTVPGRDGTYDFEDNTFESSIIEVELKFIGTSIANLRSKAREIAFWLSGRDGRKNLIFDDEPTKYYDAKIYSDIGLTNLFALGECSVQFECQPFAYETTSSEYTLSITADVTATLTNNGTFTALPVIVLSGSFTALTITQGTATLTYSAAMTADQTLTIDCTDFTVLLDTTNAMASISGSAAADFIELATGSSTLIFSGTALNLTASITFIPRYY